MTAAQVLSVGGTASALVMTCGFPRIAGAIMLAANIAAFALDWRRGRGAPQ